MEIDKEILTKREQLINVIYFIFRYTLYAIAFGFFANAIR